MTLAVFLYLLTSSRCAFTAWLWSALGSLKEFPEYPAADWNFVRWSCDVTGTWLGPVLGALVSTLVRPLLSLSKVKPLPCVDEAYRSEYFSDFSFSLL